MLYYVFVRSQAPDRMDYKVLIDMLDQGTKLRERAQSASRKSRPESSSPQKLKKRNLAQQNNGIKPQLVKSASDSDDQEENYSDEGIAQDPDDSDADEPTDNKNNNLKDIDELG